MTKKIILSSKKTIDKNTTPQDLLKILIKNRGLKDNQIATFIKPPHPKNLRPSDFDVSASQLKKATTRIKKAIKNKENILIYGDYDVDGITSTAILWQILYQKTKKVTPFIPHREHDGYGIKYQSVINFQQLKNLKFSLIITVDNGIVATKEITKLKKSGIDVIITDHHLPGKILPPAQSIMHSTTTSSSVLSWLLSTQFNSTADLGLAALGAVADCLPLISLNRSIVYHGLHHLRHHPSPGIKSLINTSSINKDSLSTYDLSFIIGPLINAAGRLDDPTNALRLLCSSNLTQAHPFAKLLYSNNKKRQLLQKQAIKIALEKPPLPTDLIIINSNPQFHPGIIGLVAGFLTQNYHLPSVIISQQKNISKGSCRSISQLNIIRTLRQLSPLFIDLGGHAAAAGFSIKTSNIPRLKKQLITLVNQKLRKTSLTATLKVDAPAKLSALKLQNIKAINQLQPFGIGNPRPLFYFQNLKIVSKRLVGSDSSHLKLKLDDPDTSKVEQVSTDAIAFKLGHLNGKLSTDKPIDLVASLDLNTWGGTTTPQLIVKEILPSN